MSYCRWSSDDGKCDLYCYYDDINYVTMIANCKPREGKEAEAKDFISFLSRSDIDFTNEKAFNEAYYKIMKPLGLIHDGQTFQDKTLEAFKARVIYLRKLGYRCPNKVITRINQEIKERDSKNRKKKNANN